MPLLTSAGGGKDTGLALRRGGAGVAALARSAELDSGGSRTWPGVGQAGGPSAARSRELFPRCSNPGCASGWIKLLRSRSAPVFEGGWCCSSDCTRSRVEEALWREIGPRTGGGEEYRHRIPLGLAMLEQGWITRDALRRAVGMQRVAGGGRLGDWLVRSGAASESQVTRAVGLQWSCPVLDLGRHDAEKVAPLLPRLFVDALRALPVRVAGGRLVYLGFEDRLDLQVAVAIERMNGVRVESGVVEGNRFENAHQQALMAGYPPCELIEAASESGLARAFLKAIESRHPVDSRLVRVHDFLWLRMWMRRQSGPVPRNQEVRDLVGAIAPRPEAAA